MEIRCQNANQRPSVEAAELPAASVKRQASTPRMQSDAERRLFDVDFQVQPSLKDSEFLDQEAEQVVHRQVGARYDRKHVHRPVVEEFDIPSVKRGEKSGLCLVLNNNRARTPQLCPQEYLCLEQVRDPIKYDDLDLRLFVSRELNIIDRDDISQTEWRGRLELLKHILYLAGYYHKSDRVGS